MEFSKTWIKFRKLFFVQYFHLLLGFKHFERHCVCVRVCVCV